MADKDLYYDSIELVRTEHLKYVWVPPLNVVQVTPKGKRRVIREIPVFGNNNNRRGAMRAIARDLLAINP